MTKQRIGRNLNRNFILRIKKGNKGKQFLPEMRKEKKGEWKGFYEGEGVDLKRNKRKT